MLHSVERAGSEDQATLENLKRTICYVHQAYSTIGHACGHIMRFSADFRLNQSLEAAAFYIAYDELKKDLKLASGAQADSGQKICDVSSKLAHQIARLRKYFSIELDDLATVFHNISHVAAQQHLRPHERQSLAGDPLITEHTPQILRATYLGLHERISNLLLFAKVNADAASRIIVKIERATAKVEQERSPLPVSLSIPELSETIRLEAAVRKNLEGLPGRSKPLEANDLPDERALNGLLHPIHKAYADSEGSPGSIATLCWLIRLAHFDLKQRTADTSFSDKSTDIGVAQSVWERLILSSIRQCTGIEVEHSITARGGTYERSPLHFAAELGNATVIAALLTAGSCADQADSIGLLPIHLAACNRRSAAVKSLLPASAESVSRHDIEGEAVRTLAWHLLMTHDNENLREVLTHIGDVNQPQCSGHNLLCEAIGLRNHGAASLLIEYGANIDYVEESSGSTPLSIAASIPDAALVQLLLDNGAGVNMEDARGWMPSERAAYKGHMEIVKMLEEAGTACHPDRPPLAPGPSRFQKNAISNHVPWLQKNDEPDKTLVWITPGSIDATAQTPPVKQLKLYQESGAQQPPYSARQSQLLYTLVVTLDDRSSEPYKCTLPILGCRINEPWLFRVKSAKDLTVRWTLLWNSPNSSTSPVGSGCSLLESASSGLRPDKESLKRAGSTVLLSAVDSSPVGVVNFSYHIVTPHPPPQLLAQPAPWQFGDGIAGHRGSGKNRIAHKQLQIGENTAQSFLTAVERGASFLEFDGQLTKDLVPVVYHDFLLSETGTDARMHDLSFEQFEYISRAQDPQAKKGKRSLSLGATDHQHLDALAERMAHTTFNKINGFKANTRGQFIHEKPSCLDDIFRAVPKDVPLNIELKYPMLFECDEWDMELTALRADLFVTVVLDKIYEHMEGRTIVLSSFSPEICIALSTKQRTLPVFFLSKTSAPRGELRTESIQQAVHFARSWGLPGIVTECTPLVKCPRLIPYVKSAGLAIASFGVGNSEAESAKASISLSLFTLRRSVYSCADGQYRFNSMLESTQSSATASVRSSG